MTEVKIEPNLEIERNWAMLAHLIALVPFPLVNVLGPLLIWLIKKENSSFIEVHAKESTNYQITVLIAVLISFWLCAILIGFLLLAVIFVTNIVLIINAAIKAKHGETFRYPFALRFF